MVDKVTLWSGLHADGMVIGRYFFKKENAVANGARYLTMIKMFENMANIDLDEMWYHQDGATAHTAHESIDLLKTKFNENIISQFQLTSILDTVVKHQFIIFFGDMLSDRCTLITQQQLKT